jgi:hypothetical protein
VIHLGDHIHVEQQRLIGAVTAATASASVTTNIAGAWEEAEADKRRGTSATRPGRAEAHGVVYIQAKPMMRSKNTQPKTIGITVSAAMIWFTRHPP